MKTCQVYIAFIAIALLALLLFFAFRTNLKTVEYNLFSNKVKNSVRVAFISDLHSCDYGEQQSDLLDKIYAQEPDIILLGGDIVDDRLSQAKAKEFLSIIPTKYPTFYVSGNHEFWSGEVDEIKSMILDYGITILEGDSIPFEINGETINICGVDDLAIGEEEFSNQLEMISEKMDAENFSILTTHRPERVDTYITYDYDLILAGHAHGGQWRIPGILNGLYAPNQGIFPEYAGGQYDFENSSMIVSRGLARETTIVPRIFNQPELVIININPSDS